MLSKVHSSRRNLYDPFAIYDSYYTPSKRNCQVLIDFVNITLHNFLKKNEFFGSPPIFTKRSEYWWWSGCMTGTVMQPRLKLRNNYAVSLPVLHRQSPNKFVE